MNLLSETEQKLKELNLTLDDIQILIIQINIEYRWEH